MYDRVVRADLYQSDRWLSLPSDTHRLVFNALIHEADDFGNFEGGPRRLWRLMHSFATVKSEADAVKIMSDLQDVDLVRRYQVNGREYWHMPRFKNRRRYTSRKYPKSPWCDNGQLSTAEKLRQQNKSDNAKPAEELPQTGGRPAEDMTRGVGEGLERGRGRGRGRSRRGDSVVHLDWLDKETWGEYKQHRARKRADLSPNSEKLLLQQLEQWHAQGQDVNELLRASIRNGWTGVFAKGSKPQQSSIDDWLQPVEKDVTNG